MSTLRRIFKPRWVQQCVVALLLSAAAVGLYQNCWDNPFVLDDLTKIMQNPDLEVTTFSFTNFMFPYPESTTQLRNDPSRPLTYMVYWICFQMDHGSPAPFHIVSTLLHAGVAILLSLITAELMLQIFGVYSLLAGTIAGLTFLTNPLMAGTVVYAYGLSDVLSAFFILLALLPLIRPSSPSRAKRLAVLGFACVCFFLALAAKQSSVVIAPLVVALDVFTHRERRRERLFEIYIPLTLIAIGYVIFRWWYFGAIGDLEGRGSTVPHLTYLAFQGVMILKYLKLTFIPMGFTIDHLHLPDDIAPWAKAVAWTAILVVSAWAARVALRSQSSPWSRGLALGWTFYLLCLLPTSSLMPTVDMFVERRAYIADLGIFLLIGGAIAYFCTRLPRPAALILLLITAGAVGAQSYVTLQRTEIYASTEKLWLESLNRDDMNMRARTNLAVYYSASKQYEASRLLLEDMLRYDPNNGGLYSKIAYIYMQPDYVDHSDTKAWEYLEKSLKLLPDNIFALYNGGVLLLRHGHFAESEKLLVRATELNPLMANAFLRAGEAALHQNHREEAIYRFQKALELNANQLDAQMYLRQLGVLK